MSVNRPKSIQFDTLLLLILGMSMFRVKKDQNYLFILNKIKESLSIFYSRLLMKISKHY